MCYLLLTIVFSIFSRDVSMLYYLMAAEAGLEIAQFNLAYLCEENYVSISISMYLWHLTFERNKFFRLEMLLERS